MTSERRGFETIASGDDLEITHHEHYLRLDFTGSFSSEVAMRIVDTMVAACTEAACTRVVLDCRRMTGQMSVVDRFDVAEYGARTIHRRIKVAVLGREDQILPDRFFEHVAVNRGLRLKLFTDTDEAADWLQEPGPEEGSEI